MLEEVAWKGRVSRPESGGCTKRPALAYDYGVRDGGKTKESQHYLGLLSPLSM